MSKNNEEIQSYSIQKQYESIEDEEYCVVLS